MPRAFGIVGVPKRGGGPLVKPQPRSLIDSSHPLARGLVFYAPFWNSGSTRDKSLIMPLNLSIAGGGINSNGLIMTDVYNAGVSFPSTHPAFTFGSAYTIVVRHSWTETDNHHRYLFSNGNGLLLKYGAAYNVATFKNSGPYEDGINDAATSVTASGQHTTAAGKYGNAMWICVDGKEVFTASNAATPATPVATSYIGGLLSGDASVIGSVYYLSIYNRTLSQGEVAQLHAQPYCFFVQPKRRVYFATSVAPVYAPAIPSVHGFGF